MTLTREEILAMKPGKELNELVMQHIFKMKKQTECESFTWVLEVDGELLDWQPAYFSPSTNISAAWEVFDLLKEKMDVSIYTDDNGKYAAECGRWVMDDCTTAPEAICKAALWNKINS